MSIKLIPLDFWGTLRYNEITVEARLLRREEDWFWMICHNSPLAKNEIIQKGSNKKRFDAEDKMNEKARDLLDELVAAKRKKTRL